MHFQYVRGGDQGEGAFAWEIYVGPAWDASDRNGVTLRGTVPFRLLGAICLGGGCIFTGASRRRCRQKPIHNKVLEIDVRERG